MRHAAHKAAKVSNERFSVAKALFTSSRGSHTAKAVRMVQLANGGGAVLAVYSSWSNASSGVLR